MKMFLIYFCKEGGKRDRDRWYQSNYMIYDDIIWFERLQYNEEYYFMNKTSKFCCRELEMIGEKKIKTMGSH